MWERYERIPQSPIGLRVLPGAKWTLAVTRSWGRAFPTSPT
jgi:hypothetical protein